MKKIRGFEKISFEQFKKDIGFENGMEQEYRDIMLPKRATKFSAGYDFYATRDICLQPGEMQSIPTGLKAYMLGDEWLSIRVRSSQGFKYNIRLKNQVGVVDADYYNNEKNEGHIFVALQNEGEKVWSVRKGEAFAQGIFQKYLVVDDDEPLDEKRAGGFGSTNKR